MAHSALSTRKRSRPLLAAVLMLALVHGALYAVLTPPWQAPDEVAHFEYAKLFSQVWRPLWMESASPELEQEIIQSLYDYHAWTYVGVPTPVVRPERLGNTPFFQFSRTLTRFSLSYVVYAIAARPFEANGIVAQLYIMRGISVILGALVVVLTYQLARLVEPAAPALAWGSALFVLLLPQHTFIAGSVSDGSLAELLSTLTVYGVVLIWRHGFQWRWLVSVLVCAFGALLSKSTAVFLLPLLLVGAAVGGWRWYTAPGRLTRERHWAWLSLLIGSAALIVGGSFFIAWFNQVSSQLVNMTTAIRHALDSFAGYTLYLNRLLTSDTLRRVATQTFESFWAYFGWMVVRLPSFWMLIPYCLTLLALLGWWRRTAERRASARPRDVPGQPHPASCYGPVALAAGLAMLVLLVWLVITPVGLGYSQGRYVFGAIAPLAVLLVGGWLGWRPTRDHGPLLLGLVAVWVAFDTVALLGVLVPYFYSAV